MSEEHTYFLDKYICIVTHLDCWLIFHEVVEEDLDGHGPEARKCNTNNTQSTSADSRRSSKCLDAKLFLLPIASEWDV